MPKPSANAKGIPRKMDLDSVEKETMRRVDKTLGTIEAFLDRWDRAKDKPDELFPHIQKVRKFHDALMRWKAEATKKQDNDETRIERLRDFVLICQSYS